ncbi:MAG: A24 family peptidase [Planctomycetaceae bacterium]|nr:A24 family peptidase [Planctomycetaceae bacterium]
MVETMADAVFLADLALIAVIDARRRVIPDGLSLGGLVFSLAVSAVLPHRHGAVTPMDGLAASLAGAGLGLAVGLILRWSGTLLLRRRLDAVRRHDPTVDAALGMGDVKLLAFIGAFLGWSGVLPVLLVACVLGAAVGVVYRIVSGRSVLPFGPFLCVGGAAWHVGVFPASLFAGLTG